MVNGIPDGNQYVRQTSQRLNPQGSQNPVDGGTLPEVVVIGKKPQFKSAIPPIEIEMPKAEIDLANLPGMMHSLQDIADAVGGRVITRNVNGNPEQIVVYKDSEGKTQRAMMGEDGKLVALETVDTRGKNEYTTKADMKKDIASLIGQEELPPGYTAQYRHGKLEIRMPGGDVMTQRDIAALSADLAAKNVDPSSSDNEIAMEVELPEITVVGQDKSKANEDIAYEVELPEVVVVGQDKSKPSDDIAYEVELPEVVVVGQDKSKPSDDIAYEVELPEVVVIGQDKSKPNDDIAYEVELPEVVVVGQDKSKPNNDLALNTHPKPQGAKSSDSTKKTEHNQEP